MQTTDELKKLSKQELEQRILKAKWDNYLMNAKMCLASSNFPKSKMGELNQLKKLVEDTEKERNR